MPEPLRPSESLASLTPQTASSTFLTTISETLSAWQSGLLPHLHPEEPAHLTRLFPHVLLKLSAQPWQSLEPNLLSFLQRTLLITLADTLISHETSDINDILPALVALLTYHPCQRTNLPEALFVVLRLPDTRQLSSLILGNASISNLTSTHLGRLLPLVQRAITADIGATTSKQVIPATQILYALITTCSESAVTKHANLIRAIVYPLLEHSSSEIRLPGLRLLTAISERCGLVSNSAGYINTSLLWNDPETAVIAIPLLLTHLPILDKGVKNMYEKRVVECVITLSGAYKERDACVESALAVVEVVSWLDEIAVNYGQRYLCAMGAFLGRVGGMVARGKLEKVCVERVCEAVVKGIKRCWIACDGFRADVLKGCLICFMEIDDSAVLEGLREVVLTLAKCHPGRMRRLVQDVRQSVEGFAGMGRVVTFLDKVESEFVDLGEMRRVEIGRLVGRFFPEVNEFNIS